MADIAVTTADYVNVVRSVRQVTHPAGEDITAGAPLTIDASGNFVNSDANGAGTLNTVRAIATRTVKSGESVTGLQEGMMDGWTFAGAYGSAVYVSDTVGRLADAAGTASLPVGHVESAHAQPLGTAADKVLAVNIPG